MDEGPQNDIYPNMFHNLKDNDLPTFDKTSLGKAQLKSKYIKSPIRLRRSSNNIPFFEHKNPVNVVPVGKIGEVKRSDSKYPDSYSRNEGDVMGKSNIKQDKNIKLNELKKREIQIDIKNDGKLVKKIYEDTKNPKSIVLNIQSPEISKDTLQNPKNSEPNPNFEKSYKNSWQNSQDLYGKIKNTPDLNIRSDYSRLKSKELINNFHNLFNANEHLNTDNSLAHESSTNGHHMTVPQANLMSNLNVPHDHNYDNIGTSNTSIINNKISRQNSFNSNNMKDMSGFWTAFEKNQMQKGLDRARITKNYLAQQVKPSSKSGGGKVKESDSGFEPAQRIELDNDVGDNSSKMEDSYRMDNLRSACDANCIKNPNAMDNPNCAACLNRMNTMNNINNIKGVNTNSITAMNNLNYAKLVNDLNTTNSLLNANGIGGLNGFNYNVDVSHQENNKLLNENSFSNSRVMPRMENKRQLEIPEESLKLINNDNLKKDAIGCTNSIGVNNINPYNDQYVTEAKRNYEVFGKNLLEKDVTAAGLTGTLFENVDPIDINKPCKKADEINLDSNAEYPLNGNEEIINSDYDNALSLNENQTHVAENEVPILIDKNGMENNDYSSNGDIGSIDALEYKIPESSMDKSYHNFEEMSFPEEHARLPEQHKDKYVKTIVYKINKAVKDDKMGTKVETVTEIYSRDEKDEEIETEADADYCNGPEEAVPSSGAKKEHYEKKISVEETFEPKKSQGREHTEENIMNPGSFDEPRVGIHQVSQLPQHEKQNDNEEETVVDIKHHHKGIDNSVLHGNSRNYEEIVPYGGDHLDESSYNQHVQNRRKTHHHTPEKLIAVQKKHHNKKKRKHFDSNKNRHLHNYISYLPSPAKLVIKKRDDSNKNHPRKRYKKRHHKDEPFFDEFDSQEYGNTLNEDVHIDKSGDSKNLIPAFLGRQLKSVDYVYDAYLHKPGVNFDEEFSTELQEISSKSDHQVGHTSTARQKVPPRKNHRVGLLHKNSVEGDYGEEEDSMTESPKKKSNVIIKKTKNEFANPVTTTESEDYDNYEDYDDVSSIKREKPKAKHGRRKQKKNGRGKGTSRRTKKQPMKFKGHDIKSFAHHRQKYKPKIHKKKKEPRSAFETQYREDHDDELPTKFWSPVYHSDANEFSKLENTNSDFQHWPSFVVDDRLNEEMLRKRSPIMKKKYPRAFNFSESSKDFFVKPQKKVRTSEVKREKPNSLLLDENPTNESKPPQGEIDNALSTEKGLNSIETQNPEYEETEICTERSVITNVCEDKENFNKTSVEITTILSITIESSSDIRDEVIFF